MWASLYGVLWCVCVQPWTVYYNLCEHPCTLYCHLCLQPCTVYHDLCEHPCTVYCDVCVYSLEQCIIIYVSILVQCNNKDHQCVVLCFISASINIYFFTSVHSRVILDWYCVLWFMWASLSSALWCVCVCVCSLSPYPQHADEEDGPKEAGEWTVWGRLLSSHCEWLVQS